MPTPTTRRSSTFTGSNVLFDTPGNGGNDADGTLHINGSASVENVTCDLAPQMRFTNAGGTVTLKQAGQRATGRSAWGMCTSTPRSDQAWICDETAFVRMTGSVGATVDSTSYAGKYLVESIDGGRLDNLGQLNIKIGRQRQRQLQFDDRHAPLRRDVWQPVDELHRHVRARPAHPHDGKRRLRAPGRRVRHNGDPVVSGYGLILRNATSNSDTQIFTPTGTT